MLDEYPFKRLQRQFCGACHRDVNALQGVLLRVALRERKGHTMGTQVALIAAPPTGRMFGTATHTEDRAVGRRGTRIGQRG
jgi:hypothetical protein